MKTFLKLTVIIFFYLSSPLLSQANDLSGRVYNGSNDSTVVSNIKVTLLQYRNNNLADDSTYTKYTNSKGVYKFSRLPMDSSLDYYPMVSYKSIVYYGPAIDISKKSQGFTSDVVVYDTTSQVENVRIQLEHLFIEKVGERLQLREILIFINSGNQTFLGKNINDPDNHYVLKFPLPENFVDFKLLTTEAQNSVFLKDRTFYNTDLLSPGSKQLSFRLSVPFKGKWQLSRLLEYSVNSINIFVANTDLTLDGPGVKAMGGFALRGRSYQRYSIHSLDKGMNLLINIKDNSGTSFPVQWIILIIIVLFFIIGFGYTFKKV